MEGAASVSAEMPNLSDIFYACAGSAKPSAGRKLVTKVAKGAPAGTPAPATDTATANKPAKARLKVPAKPLAKLLLGVPQILQHQSTPAQAMVQSARAKLQMQPPRLHEPRTPSCSSQQTRGEQSKVSMTKAVAIWL